MSAARDSLDGMDLLPVLLGLLLGAAGLTLGWFWGRRTGSGADVEVERRAAAQRLADAQAAATQRLADAEAGYAQRLADREDAWEGRLADAERAAAERVADAERRAEEQLRSERESAQLRLAELKADTQRLKDEFAALSARALAENSETFLRQAEERLKRAGEAGQAELAKREEAVKALVEPLARTLGEVKAEMTSAEKARAQAHGALAEQVRAMQSSSEALRTETSQLVTALRAPQVRGRWGELQLRRVVEAAGMLPHVDFTEQASVRTDDGLLRPDLVVHLPGEKNVVVDSKVAFNGYLEAMEATDEAQRAKRLAAHARHMRDHVDSLGAKAYWDALGATPEFVVMFVPAETFLGAALEEDPSLWEHAFSKNVVIATPATLVALLRTVGYTWRQEKLAAEAQQVFEVGRELHKRLATFGKHLAELGRKLNGTVEQFNKLNRSIDSQLVTQVRRFSALQDLEPAFQTPPPLEVLAVPAAKPDLYGEVDLREITAAPHPAPDDAEAERRAVLGADEDQIALLDVTDLRAATPPSRKRA
jgi:DNA recombination protein RmuC